MNAETLVGMFRLSHGALHMNLEGVTHEEGLVQPRPAGNCLNWVVAHVVATRDQMFTLAGLEPVLAPALGQRYRRPAAPVLDAGEARGLDDWRADLDRSQERLVAWLATLTPERLATPVDGARLPGRPRNLAELLAFFQFHESYHVGQAGLLRRIAGKDGAIR